MSLLAESAMLQLRLIRADRDYLLDLIRAPLVAVLFLTLIQHSRRTDLSVNAVLAPALMALWGMALLVSGEIIDTDRWLGTLEPTLSAPVPFWRVIVGRIMATTALSLLVLAEVWLVSVAFGAPPVVFHPWVFTAALLATVAAMIGWSLLMAVLFVATRTARTFQNSLSYPLFLLGGVFVPAESLPEWMRPLARIFFLSWSSDLLRDSLRPSSVTSVGGRLVVIAGLGAAGFLIGLIALRRMLHKARAAGSLGLR